MQNHYLINFSIWEKIRIRIFLYRYIIPFTRKRKSVSDKVIPANTYIFSQPRSGSTWLAELLSCIPNSAVIDEPLWRGNSYSLGKLPHPEIGKCDEVRELDFYFSQPIPQEADWPEAEDFFQKLFKVQIPKYGLFMETNIPSLKSSNHFIFKFCYGNLLLPWLIDKFSIRPIFLIRHPCAVVRSLMKISQFKNVMENPRFLIPEFRFNHYYKKYGDILSQIKHPEENLAAFWSLNNYGLLTHTYHNRKWLTVSYENLLENFDYEIQRIFQWLDKPVPPEVYEKQFRPSKMTHAYSVNRIKNKTQISAWKEELSSEQIDSILSVANSFGLKAYNRNTVPNLNKLYSIND